jgi:hypothetical protein
MSKPKKGGDCYAVAGRAAINAAMAGAEVKVVHGTVATDEVPRHGHAWIEYQHPAMPTVWLVRDMANGHDVTLPRAAYYRAGRVANVARYDGDEAIKQMVSSGHFGPWHDDGVSL